MKIAFFDAKPYDRPGFDAYTAGTGLEMKYFETKKILFRWQAGLTAYVYSSMIR